MPLTINSPGGGTRACGLLGNPVEHSLSPAMHNAAFKYLKLDYIYTAFRVQQQSLGSALGAVSALNMAGVNITVPHKEAALQFMDYVDPGARLCGAVNTVVNSNGKLHGYNTDGQGFLLSLGELGFDPAGKSILLLGAGGAARGVAAALALAGASEIMLSNRTTSRAEDLVSGLSRALSRTKFSLLGWYGENPGPKEYSPWQEALGRAALVVNTTPLGLGPDAQHPPFPHELINPGHLVADLIYNPPATEFLRRAQARGARVLNGTGMLLYQGVLAFELFTGVKAPVGIMKNVLADCLGGVPI